MPWQERWTDPLTGPTLGDVWRGGYLNKSGECRISPGPEGLVITLQEGRAYASAGVVTHQPVPGDFEASVRFIVEAPAQGTTFELAAITIDPPRFSALDLAASTAQTRSRVYDVHGAPPYVSSEFDENDGWRIGWNRSTAQGRPDDRGEIISDNHFNRYGPDVGPKPQGRAEGWLRLVREGDTWRSYGREGEDWTQTGEVADMNMPRAVFLRLAGKHWVKTRAGLDVAPANRILFLDFSLRQPG